MSALRAWFEDPLLRSMLVDMLLAGVAAAVVCSVLSVLVVLKRLSFVGQGVSHSAFGGLGFAAMLGVVGGLVGGATEGAIGGGAMGSGWGWGSIGGVVVVSLFCMAAAVVMGLVSDRRTMTLDASIGAILAATMAAGFIMLDLARRGVVLGGVSGGGGGGVPSAESLLFGQISGVGGGDVVLAWVMAGLILGVLWWFRRPVLFWAFDESAAPAFGVRATACKLGVLAMLALAIVVSMRLVGVVLVTAMLVLPGATALKLSDRLGRVVCWSIGVGVLGVVLGVLASLALDMQTGPTIVLTMVVLFALGGLSARVFGSRARL